MKPLSRRLDIHSRGWYQLSRGVLSRRSTHSAPRSHLGV